MASSDDIKKINDEINRLRKELGKLPQSPFDIKELEKAKESLKGLNSELREMGSDLDYVSKSFKDSVNELSRQNFFLTNAKNSLKGISSISDKILQYRKGETTLSEKQLQILQQQAKAKFDSLRNDIKSGQLGKENTKEVLEALKSEILFNEEVQRTVDIQKQVNKEIGLLGTGLDGAAKVLAKMGFGDLSKPLQDAIDKTKNARLQQALNNDEVKKLTNQLDSQNKKQLTAAQLRAGFGGKELKTLQLQKDALESQNKELDSQTSKYKNIGKALTDQLTKANLLDFVFKELIVAFGTSQKGISELAKGLGISASNATQMRQEFASIANSSMNANISVKGLQESQIAVGQALGTNAMLNREDLETMTDIVKKTGLQHEELVGIEKLSLATGKSLDSNVESALGGATAYASQNKLAISSNKILKEVNKASSSLKLSLGGSVEALGKAVVQAQKFGLTLEQANSLSSSLLDFESSIENELSAELLTGKNLNFEKARQLSLEGDIAGASEEVLKQLKGSEEFSKMNVIQQEAMAKAVGLTRDELASSLIEREALAKMSAEEGETASQAYERLKASGKTESEIVKLLGEKTAQQLEQQSAQDKFNASVEKLREIFVQVMDSLAPIFDMVVLILEPVQMIFGWFGKIGQSVGKLIGPLGTVGKLLKGIASLAIAFAAYKTFGAVSAGLAATGIGGLIAPVVGAAAAAGVLSAGMSFLGSIKDGAIDPRGGLLVSGEKGSIQLDKDDSIVAGTNLFGDKSQSNTSGQPQQQSSTSVNVDMSQTNALLQQLITIISAGGDVIMDGQKVGQALNLVAYKTQ
jgi:hypothetical protein